MPSRRDATGRHVAIVYRLRTRLALVFAAATLAAKLTTVIGIRIEFALLLAAGLAWLGLEWVLIGRIRDLARTVERLDAQHPAGPSSCDPSTDEVDRLGHAIERLAEALQHHRSEQQITEAQLANIVTIAADAIVSVDDEQNIVLFNPGAEQIFGYRADEIIGRPLDLLIPERLNQAHRAHVQEFGSGPSSARPMGERQEIAGRRKDGTEFPAEASISRMARHGRTIYTAILRDVTERKRAEATLRTSEKRLAESQRVAHLGSWELDLVTNVLWWSEEVYRIFEIDPQQFGASYEAFLETVHPEDREFVNQAYTESLQRKTPYDIVHRLLMKDGRIKYVNERCETEYRADGTPVRSVGTVLEITERKRSEEVVLRIADGISTVTGAAFFRSLLKHLADTLGVEYAFIGGLAEGRTDRIRTLSVYANGEFADNFEYDLRGTPCEQVVGKQLCTYAEQVQQHFPDDRLLVDMSVQSYIGVPLFDSSGQALGLMAVMGRRAFPNVPLGEALLRIFAVRAAAEFERQRMVDQLTAALYERENVMETIPDFLYILDAEGRFVRWNTHAEKATGRSAAELAGAPLSSVIAPEERPGVDEAIHHAFAHGSAEVEAHIVRTDGTTTPYHWSCAALKDGGGRVTGIVGIGRDISESRRAEETIQRLAFYDALTGLPNRILIHDRLTQAIQSGERRQVPVAFLLMDIDHFKDLNNTLGHHHGDLLLKEIGPRIRSVLRQSDTVGRLGGDEFAVLLPDTDLEGALSVAKKIQHALEAPFNIEGLNFSVETSMGVALFPEHGATADTLIQRADVAMYAAKHSGEGFVVYAADRDHYSPKRLALMGELRYAIEHHELTLFFQPKIHLATRRVIGVEALVRWKHPHRGMIPPDEFIPLAEHSGLIRPLTLWVLTAALDRAGRWAREGFRLSVAVNLSTRNLLDTQLPQHLANLLRRMDAPVGRLELEITESTIMADPKRALKVLTELHQMGIPLAIDDFGTGYSSLGYLRHLPVSAVKIDKSFVKNMDTDDGDAVIVRSTIELAHNLGLQVVAEGVETEYAWERLLALGCDAAQGYYMSPPLSAEGLGRWFIESPWQVAMAPSASPKAA